MCAVKGCVMDIGKEEDTMAFFQRCYENLQRTFFDSRQRPLLHGKRIDVDLKSKIGGCFEIFWHITGFSEEDLGSVPLPFKPCVNSLSTERCDGNCINKFKWKEMPSKERRYICLYRASFCGLIPEIVRKANENAPDVKYWEKTKGHKTRIYLRYQFETVDYLVVFEVKSEIRVFFVTAFPLFFERAKMQSDKDYFKYNENNKNQLSHYESQGLLLKLVR